jgi:hypothetical protein
MARFLLLILLSLTLNSCSDIFSTRDPEDPQGNTDNNFNESVAELKTSFKTSLLGLDGYLYESLFINPVNSEYTYSYSCEASDISQPGIFSDWSVEEEKKFINGIKVTSTSFSDIELISDPVDETADTASLNMEYSILVTTTESRFTIKGSLVFDLIKLDGHFWYIRKWTDISPQGNISFSKMKEPYAF